MTIEISKLPNEKPYLVFKNYYDLAIKKIRSMSKQLQ